MRSISYTWTPPTVEDLRWTAFILRGTVCSDMVDLREIAKQFVIACADYESILTNAVTEAQKELADNGRLHQAVGIFGNSDPMKTTKSRSEIAMRLAVAEVFSSK